MEGHATKRRRIYSLEPTKILHASFASKYVNNLVPALHNIKKLQISSDHEKDNNICQLKQFVKYEVDMALASSAEGFAWSQALKDKLQISCANEGKIDHLLNQNDHHSFPMLQYLEKPLVIYTKFCPNPKSNKPKNMKLKSSKRSELRLQRQEIKAAAKDSDQEEEWQIAGRLNNLRNLLPGGNHVIMGVDEMLKEVASYLLCLEVQVNILRCLVETH